jgi:hypothetical protein
VTALRRASEGLDMSYVIFDIVEGNSECSERMVKDRVKRVRGGGRMRQGHSKDSRGMEN